MCISPFIGRHQNKLEGEEVVTFAATLKLSYLKLQGNPCVGAVPHFRKVVIAAMPGLNYLDEAPVRAKDRRLACAFASRGFEGEREERERIKAEEAEEAERHRREFDRMVEARCRGSTQQSIHRGFTSCGSRVLLQRSKLPLLAA